MNEQYTEMITPFPLFAGHTIRGARLLLELGEVRSGRSQLGELPSLSEEVKDLSGRVAAAVREIPEIPRRSDNLAPQL